MGLGVMQVTNLCMTTPGSDMLAVPGEESCVPRVLGVFKSVALSDPNHDEN